MRCERSAVLGCLGRQLTYCTEARSQHASPLVRGGRGGSPGATNRMINGLAVSARGTSDVPDRPPFVRGGRDRSLSQHFDQRIGTD